MNKVELNKKRFYSPDKEGLRPPKFFGGLSLTGFTLLELVIVLSILAIIASTAVSTFIDIANKALGVQEDATMRSLQNAAFLFFAENDRWWGINETEDPFALLENPPPHVVCRLTCSRPRIVNVDWRLNYVVVPPLWIIECPHRDVGIPRGQAWFFTFQGAGIAEATQYPH